jgi:hypothetical protein
MSIIKFYRDKNQDKEMTYNFFSNEDPSGWLFRAIGCGMPLHLAEDLSLGKDDSKSNLYNFMDKEYNIINANSLYINTQKNVEDFWNVISIDFSNSVKLITGKEVCSYNCLLSMFLTTSAWNEKINISRKLSELNKQDYLIAFEILLSHCFKIIRDKYSEDDISSAWDAWAICEITASFILRDNSISILFKDINKSIDDNWFKDTNYPFLAKYEDSLKELYLNKTSFYGYIDNAVNYIKKNKVNIEE